CNLQPKDAAKMPESAWKLLFYSLSWSYGIYLLFFTDYPFFYDPPSVFYDWQQGMEVPRDIAIAYLLQGSFYGHSIYATAYMDTWRKDSVVMLLHHVVTLTLIASSYAFSVALPLHETFWSHKEWCSPVLPFPRSRVAIPSQMPGAGSGMPGELAGCAGPLLSQGATKATLLLCPGRFWFRLYWFPLKVLYATCHSSLQSVPNIPFYFFFNALLLVLTLMNIYWFLYIVLFVAKVLLGQMQEVNDVREYDVEESRKT
ncbi:CERS1 synthase, partial [Menura novaehollandiae]|nr:CERS1 synthase [Menura novaehollandiae]